MTAPTGDDGVVIRVLGAVEVRTPAGTVVPPVQQAKVLALLVAAGPGVPVPRVDLAREVWGRATDTELLSPVLSRLRRTLQPVGLTVSAGRTECAVVRYGAAGRDPSDAVDLHRFTRSAAEAAALHSRGELAAAADTFAGAARLWEGPPFALHGVEWDPPLSCRRAHDQALRLRTRVVQGWASVAVLHAVDTVDAVLAHLAAHPRLRLLDGGPELAGSLWMLRFLSELHGPGPDAAVRWRDSGARPAIDPLVVRADQLLELHEHGFPVFPPPAAPPPNGTTGTRQALDELLAFARSAGDGGHAPIAVDGPPRVGRTRLLGELEHAAAGVGVRVLRAGTTAEDPLAPWRTIAAFLWAEALRVVPVPQPWPPQVAGHLARLVFSPGPGWRSPGDPLLVAEALAHLVRESARRTPLVLAVDDAHLLGLHGGRLLWLLSERLGHARAGFVITRRIPAGEVVGPEEYLPGQRVRSRIALRPGDDAVALSLDFLRAARARRAAHDPQQAGDLALLGLDALPAGSAADGPDLVDTRFRLLMELGHAAHDRAEMAAAADAFLDAHRAAEGNPVSQASAVVMLARRWSDPGRQDDRLLGLIDRSLQALKGLDGDEAGALTLRLTAHRAHKGTLSLPDAAGDGAGLARRALTGLAGAALPAEAVCDVLTECRWALFDSDSPAQLVALARELEQAATGADDEHFRGEAHVALVIDELRHGRFTSALQSVEQHRVLLDRTGHPFQRWLQATMDTMLELWRGEFAEAGARLSGESRILLRQLATPGDVAVDSLTQTYTGQLFWLYREQGRIADLPELGVGTTMGRRSYFPVWSAAMALLHQEAGRPTTAADLLTGLVAETDDLAALPPHGWAVPTLVLVAEIVAQLARADGGLPGGELPGGELTRIAALVAGRLAPHADEIALAGWPTVLLGPVSRSIGLMALVRGDAAGAVAAFTRAERLVRTSPPQWTRLRVDHARALLAGGRPAEAEVLLARARTTAGELGMGAIAAEAEQLLGASGRPGG